MGLAGEFTWKGPIMRKAFPGYGVIKIHYLHMCGSVKQVRYGIQTIFIIIIFAL